MKVMTITFKAAFLDRDQVTSQGVAALLMRSLRDGLGAEVSFTTDRDERDVDYPDPSSDNDAASEVWQERAYAELDEEGGLS